MLSQQQFSSISNASTTTYPLQKKKKIIAVQGLSFLIGKNYSI